MKKFYKVCLIAAGVLMVVSIVILCICAYVSKDSFAHNVKQTVVPETMNIIEHAVEHSDTSIGLTDFNADGNYIHCGFNKNYPVYSGKHTDKEAANAKDIRKLDIRIGGGTFILEKSTDNNCFQLDSESENAFQYFVSDNTFYIIGFEGASIKSYSNHNSITLRIPADISFSETDISMGAGSMEWNFLSTDVLTISAGSGEISMNNVTSQETDASIGAGSLYMHDSALEDASFEVGVGSLSYSGVIRGDLTACCGMGNADFAFSDSENKHNYFLSGGMGNISIGNHNFGGLSYDKDIDNNAASDYDLSCSMGNMSVTFED